MLGAMAVTTFGCGNSEGTESADDVKAGEPIVIEKSEFGNPIGGFDAEGNLIYEGDPAVLVDGDTVYLYTGHDTAKEESYVIPEYQCYSAKDMKNWKQNSRIIQSISRCFTVCFRYMLQRVILHR